MMLGWLPVREHEGAFQAHGTATISWEGRDCAVRPIIPVVGAYTICREPLEEVKNPRPEVVAPIGVSGRASDSGGLTDGVDAEFADGSFRR